MDWKFGKLAYTERNVEISQEAVTWNMPTWAEICDQYRSGCNRIVFSDVD